MLVQGDAGQMKLGFLRRLPKEKLQKLVLICMFTLIAVGGVIQFYVLKNWSALAEAEASITKLKDQIRQVEHKERDAKQDVAYRAELKSFVETQRAVMISGDPFAWVVREISLLAEQHPVRVTALHPGDKVESSGKSKRQMYATRIDISGTYGQIGVFVRDLENKFPTGEIHSLSISGTADDKGQHAATLGIALPLQPAEPSRKTPEKKTI
jgi:Tfp pilus assembly protein PilO